MVWNTHPAENPPVPPFTKGRRGRFGQGGRRGDLAKDGRGGLHRTAFRPGTRGPATRRLRLLLCASLLCVALPLTLLLSRVYQYLAQEMFYQYRSAAEEVVKQVNQRLADILQGEELRPFDEYSFLKVTANPLFKNSAIIASPLSELPPQSAVPGVIGYFQINPDGSFNSPVLPDLDEAELSANAERFGFGSSELARRLALRSRIEALLRAGAPTTERRKRQQHAAQSSAVPAPMASAPAAPDPGASGFALRQDKPTTPSAEAPQTPAYRAMPQPKLSVTKSSPYRERRKEQVALPEQSTVAQVQDALDKLNALPQETGRSAEKRVPSEAQSTAKDAADKKQRDAVKILSFEGEVDPFQFTVLSTGPLGFFRKAWRNNLRYIQGFVVDTDELLQQLLESPMKGTSLGQLASLTVSYQGQEIFSRPPAETNGPAPLALGPLYNATLEAPLDTVDLAFRVGSVPRSGGAVVVDALALTLLLVLLVGHYGLYRLGLQQIDLAVQRSDFVSAVSHELKTPLTAIRMYGEMLRAGWVQDETRRQAYYDFIFFESERLSRLIANVLQWARLTNHDAPLELKEYTLHSLLDVVRSKVSTQADAAGFTLRFLAAGEAHDLAAASVLVDEDAFVQIFINLVDNALKFSANAEVKCVDIGLRRHASQPQQAVLFVRDYGPGVARDQMQRIFQLFYRAEDELTRQTQGTGIGLALVKVLATKMHATVHLHNRYPGAEFQLTFPTVYEGANRGGA
jgi:two-component system, OmpR family, phosphate regulon sensor histidine kinase PhoR